MFFDSTPDFLYPDFFEAGKFKLSKNLFRRVRARDSINSIFSSSTKYIVKSGQTPDEIAFDLLGDSSHYWTILLINNITDTQTQWPYDDYELDKIIEDRYGDLADKIRHWETKEVKDSYDNSLGFSYQTWIYSGGKKFKFVDRGMSGDYTLYRTMF